MRQEEPPVPMPPAPAPAAQQHAGTAAVPAPPQRVADDLPVPAQPIGEDAITNRSLDDLNRDSPLKPAFFVLDSADLDDAGARPWSTPTPTCCGNTRRGSITIEGHCDERGTAEYNLALGERRAVAVKTYLVSLGISPDRLRTVSYGKEFPFDPGHTDESWAKNRRAQFVITSK